MKETIVKFVEGPFPKKYTAFLKNKETRKVRKLHFSRFTPLQLYKNKNHGTQKRMRNYFSRHSGTSNRKSAIDKEIQKSKGHYTPKILSHVYLW